MATPGKRVIRRFHVTLTKTNTGWVSGTDGLLAAAGRRGLIRNVLVREDASGLHTAATFYLLDGSQEDGDATPADEHIFYESASTTLTAHATDASLNDNVMADGGAAYEIKDPTATNGSLRFAANVTGSSGAGTLHAVIEVEIEVG